jgi:hypothetical protein
MPRQRKSNDLSRSLTALDMDTTLIAVVELSLSSWLVAERQGIGVARLFDAPVAWSRQQQMLGFAH